MRPDEYASTVNIPLTFDNVKSSKSLGKLRVLIGLVAFILTLLFTAIIIINSNNVIWIRIIYGLLFFISAVTFIRIFIFKERYFLRHYTALKEQGFQCKDSTLWSIASIEEGELPICRFFDGTQAVFIKMYRGSIVGNGRLAEYNHYEAVSDAMKEAARLRLSVLYLNTALGSTGDTYMSDAIEDLDNCKSDRLSYVLTRVYDNICGISKDLLLDEDIFVVYGLKDINFNSKVYNFIEALMDANYSGYEYLDKKNLNYLYSALLNLPTCDINNFLSKVKQGSPEFLRVIYVERDGVRENINLTSAEERQERNYKLAQAKVKGSRKKAKKLKNITLDLDNDLGLNISDSVGEESLTLTNEILSEDEDILKNPKNIEDLKDIKINL